MQLNLLKNPDNNKKKRLGRGRSSGHGKTSGRGTKGQKSRSGHNIPRRFEGGQSTLIQRLPKRKGFKFFRKGYQIINLDQIEKNFSDGEVVSPQTLRKKGLTEKNNSHIKVLGRGNLTKKILFKGVRLSNSVKRLIK